MLVYIVVANVAPKLYRRIVASPTNNGKKGNPTICKVQISIHDSNSNFWRQQKKKIFQKTGDSDTHMDIKLYIRNWNCQMKFVSDDFHYYSVFWIRPFGPSITMHEQLVHIYTCEYVHWFMPIFSHPISNFIPKSHRQEIATMVNHTLNWITYFNNVLSIKWSIRFTFVLLWLLSFQMVIVFVCWIKSDLRSNDVCWWAKCLWIVCATSVRCTIKIICN